MGAHNPGSGAHPCCLHCKDAESDHVEHGGTVERDRHEASCSLCDYDKGIRPYQVIAWDAGFRAGFESGDSGYIAGTNRRLVSSVNPYRVTPPGAGDQ